jgi:MFS family permease
MATPNRLRRVLTVPARAWGGLLDIWPLLAVALVWLTTAGHTMNFREMSAARGWVAAENYTLHSSYLIALGLTMLTTPRLIGRFRFRGLTVTGLVLFILGSAVNGFLITWPLSWAIAGRIVAGVGGGLVIAAAPGLLDSRWDRLFAWAAIVLPPLGPAVVSLASFTYGWSSWEGGFLFEGAAGVVCLLGLVALPHTGRPREPSAAARWPVSYLPWLIIALGCAWYCLHWGQLQGWLQSGWVVAALTGGALSAVWCGWVLWPHLDRAALRENWLRLLLMAFGGVVQFFHGTTMTVYSSMFVNYNAAQRFWLVWSMPIGAALALVLTVFWQRRRRLGLTGILLALLILAGGMSMLNQLTLSWPYWSVQQLNDVNWFLAPLHWEQAPGRLVIGFGVGLLLASVNALASRRAEVEVHVRQVLPVVQTVAGGFSISLLVLWLIVGHQTHYSYTAEASSIQAQEYAARISDLRDRQIRAGVPPAMADRQALSLLYRSVNYQADNLTYAEMYGVFCVASLLLAGLVLLTMVRNWLRRVWRRKPDTGPGPLPNDGTLAERRAS